MTPDIGKINNFVSRLDVSSPITPISQITRQEQTATLEELTQLNSKYQLESLLENLETLDELAELQEGAMSGTLSEAVEELASKIIGLLDRAINNLSRSSSDNSAISIHLRDLFLYLKKLLSGFWGDFVEDASKKSKNKKRKNKKITKKIIKYKKSLSLHEFSQLKH